MHNVTISGRSYAYAEAGNAPPLLLVHGFPLDHESWAPQLEVFGHQRRVIAPDLAGFGRTGTPGAPSLDAHADDLAALLDEIGAARVVLVGLSMGGYIALAMWRKHRERIAALVLADTRSGADAPEAQTKRVALADRVLAEGIAPLLGNVQPGLLSEAAPARIADTVRTIIERQPPAGAAAALRAMAARVDSTPDLPSIDVPVLVIVGEQDAITPASESEAMVAALPRASLARIPRAGHLSNLEEPGAFNGALRAFLDEVDAESPSA
jgi:pimeloyl-ACP methyl ester carboxylesterase